MPSITRDELRKLIASRAGAKPATPLVGQTPTASEEKPLAQKAFGQGIFSRILQSGAGKMFTGGIQAFAETLGTVAAAATGEAEKIDVAAMGESESRRQLAELLNRPGISETQKSRIRSQLGEGQQTVTAGEALPSIQKSAGQIFGEGALTGLEALSGGGLSGLGKAAVKGFAKEGLKEAVKFGAKTGGAYGLIGGAASAAAQGEDLAVIAKGGLVGGGLGVLTGGAIPIAAKGVGGTIRIVGKGGQKINAAVKAVKSGRAQEVLSGLDTPTINVLDPTRKVSAAVAAGEHVAPEALIPKAQNVERVSQRLDYYTAKARRASQDASQATPLEFAGQEAEKTLDLIQNKLQRAGQMKQQELAQFGNKEVVGIGESKAGLLKKLEDRVGSTFDAEGNIVNAPGRVSKIALDPADQKLLSDVHALINNLDDTDTVLRADGTVDAIQDLLYKRKQNVAAPVNSAVESVLKEVTGEINGKVTRTAGQTYSKANRRYSAMIDVRDKLNKMLGSEGTKGGALMKRVFSPSDAGTKALFDEVEKITGVNLVDEAVLAKFAMETAGDARQASLLQEVTNLRPGNITKTFISKALEAVLKRLGNKEKAAQRVIEQARERAKTGSFIPQPVPKADGPLTTGPRETYSAGSKKTVDIFNKSKGQKIIGTIEGKKIVLGDFGKKHQERKMSEGKENRFPEFELQNVLREKPLGKYRANLDKTSHRYDNIAWVFPTTKKEKVRIVYTKKNLQGAEEIIGWHEVDKTKDSKYLSTLESFGAPDRT